MGAFKIFLQEVARDPDRAHKLLDYVWKRQKPQGWFNRKQHLANGGKPKGGLYISKEHKARKHDEILSHYTKATEHNLLTVLKKKEPNAPVKKFKVKDLHPIQHTVEVEGVAKKLHGTDKGDSGPIRVATHKGKHYIADGHHRFFTAKLRGDTEIEGYHHIVPIKKAKK